MHPSSTAAHLSVQENVLRVIDDDGGCGLTLAPLAALQCCHVSLSSYTLILASKAPLPHASSRMLSKACCMVSKLVENHSSVSTRQPLLWAL